MSRRRVICCVLTAVVAVASVIPVPFERAATADSGVACASGDCMEWLNKFCERGTGPPILNMWNPGS